VLSLVVLVALVGGLWIALPAAVLGGLALNWFFTPPYGTLAVASHDALVVLAVYLGVAVAVSYVVDLAARRTAEAERARAEARALTGLAGAALAEQQTLPDLLERIRQVFGMRQVQLLEGATGTVRTVVAQVRTDAVPGPDERELRIWAGPRLALAVRGPELFAADRRVLESFAGAAANALQGRRLAEQASAARELEAADRMRTALLAAVGHDLRTPLSGIKAAVSSLRQDDVTWTAQEQRELLQTIEESADRLQALVANLLDASRLQAGAVHVEAQPVALDEVVGRVLLAVSPDERSRVVVDVDEHLPEVDADAVLLERALANVVDNALRYAPVGTSVLVRARTAGERVVCEVVDHGRGVSAGDREQVFAPFQRLGDRSQGGVGLGLAVARGFTEAMGGTLTPHDTSAGGLTMRLSLPVAVPAGVPR
jgi:K+-sensing histidine kinase KdpD